MNAALIFNPRAGRHHAQGALDPALTVLRRAGWTLTVHETAAPGNATGIARAAAESGVDAVLVAGGDGTVNEAVQALANTKTAFGYLPYGTVNVWARELSIPRNVHDAAVALVSGHLESVDLGIVNNRYFLLMTGIGFDGYVLQRARPWEQHKDRLGILPYVASGLSSVLLYRGADIELRYDGIIRRVQALMLVVGNTRLYGGGFRLTPDAVVNDGWLDVTIVKGRGPLALARNSLPLLLSGTIVHSDIERLRVQTLQVTAQDPLPVQVDGELLGTTPVAFQVAPRALQAIIPEGFASTLIA
ncbi:MAG: diacylglycerol kinase family lipid kinase [Chloroflexota bacterium]